MSKSLAFLERTQRRRAAVRVVVEKKMRLGLDPIELNPETVPEYVVDELTHHSDFRFTRASYRVRVVCKIFSELYGAALDAARRQAFRSMHR